MKYIYSLLLAFCLSIFSFGQTSVTYTVVNDSWAVTFPTNQYFDETDQITITFKVPEATFGVSSSRALYLWAWSVDNTNVSADCPTNGSWKASNATNKLSYVSTDAAGIGTYTYTMNTVKSFYGNTNPLAKIGMLVKAYNPASDAQKSGDINLNVGRFQILSSTPPDGTVNFVAAGTKVPILVKTTLNATYEMYVNGVLYTSTTTPSTSFNLSGASTFVVNSDSYIKIVATPTDPAYTPKTVTIVENINPAVQSIAIPAGVKQGINYDPADPTHVYLAVYAPEKDYVHVIGDFDSDSYVVKNKYLMNRDTNNPNLYWIELKNLTSKKLYTFQYRFKALATSNSGTIVKAADPFSRLILSPDDDPYINFNSTVYPNLPKYPEGQKYDVSVLQTGMPDYNWTVTNFTKPAKEKLVVYELSMRDFTPEATWDATRAKIPYLKTLGVNAVELMPVMEFDGNNSWGYNTGFHYALDKAYGTPDSFKQFIDECHKNGIAVILDIALNHATGRSPIQRMWTTSLTGDYGATASNNPYFNTVDKHSYGVFNDFNHSLSTTKYYVQRVLEQWIKEYKVDGFRWDLTKGFTQSCSGGDDACTNSYLQDRVDILKGYADNQWSYDANSYIIFEHLGVDNEEQQWANYKNGVMMWSKLNTEYNQNTMGYGNGTDNSFARANFTAHGFAQPRAMNYGESHDEERLMYKNLQYGAVNGSYSVKDLATSLQRMKAYGAVFLTIPGPKMIWQFGELGYDKSIYTCNDGTVNTESDSTPGNCKLDPKPSAFKMPDNPASTSTTYSNYYTDANRKALYDTWAKINYLTQNNLIFQSKTFNINNNLLSNLAPRIYIWDGNNIVNKGALLKNVVIIANFGTTTQNIATNFDQAIPQWYNLMDVNAAPIPTTTSTISLAPGDFRIYGNAPANVMATAETLKSDIGFSVSPNPITNSVAQVNVKNAKNAKIYIYDMSGKLMGTQKLATSNGSETIPMNYPSGLYLLQLKSDSGTSSTKVIVR